MEKAYHVGLAKKFTVKQYGVEFGPKLDANAQERWRPSVICQACDTEMHTVGEGIQNRVAVWAHNPSSTYCPLKAAAAPRYELLAPINPDEVRAIELRTSFFSNWRVHWAQVHQIMAACEIHTFKKFIQYMDTNNIWAQRNLPEWHIPYMFLVTCDFPPPKGAGARLRKTWIRCFFDTRVRTIQDLWIRAENNWAFLVAEYGVPPRAKPGAKYLLDFRYVTPNPNFLNDLTPIGNPYQISIMEKTFPKELT